MNKTAKTSFYSESPENEGLLVDKVEMQILQLFLERGYCLGDSLPGELELANHLGIARSVLREALSRLRFIGLVKTRPRRGMTLSEPDIFPGLGRMLDPHFFTIDTLLELLDYRITMELGTVYRLSNQITEAQIEELEIQLANSGLPQTNTYDISDEFAFHRKLYEFSGNAFLVRFQSVLYTVITYINRTYETEIRTINERLLTEGNLVSHEDILESLRSRNPEQVMTVMDRHFLPYRIFKACKI